MTTLVLALVLGTAVYQETGQERPSVPDDSVQLVVSGCLKGRVLAVSDTRETDTQSGPIVRGKSFRLAGKGDIMKEVKKEDGHFVEVTGIVKRSALDSKGIKIGKRVEVGGGSPSPAPRPCRPGRRRRGHGHQRAPAPLDLLRGAVSGGGQRRAVPLTLLCIATYRKGDEFLRECRRQGCRVLLLTEEKLRDADWPREAIDAFFYVRRDMPDEDIRKGAAHLARTERIDRIVALDDFDVETGGDAARVPVRARHGRDHRARLPRQAGDAAPRAQPPAFPCPDFVHVLNHEAIAEWTARVPPPWVLKPRSQAAAIGIRKLHSADELWRDARGARRRPGRLPARTVRARRRLSRRFDRLRRAGAVRGRQPLPHAADGGRARGRHLRDLDAATTTIPRRRRAARAQRARADLVRPAARRVAHRVHPRARRRLAFPRNLGPRRRRLHRRRRRSGERPQPVARVGAGRRSPARTAPTIRRRARAAAGRHRAVAGAAGVAGHRRGYQDPEIVGRIQEAASRRAGRRLAAARAGRARCSTTTSRGSRPTSTPRRRRPSGRSTDGRSAAGLRHAARAGARVVAAARERARHRRLPAAVVRQDPAAVSRDLHAGRPEPRRSGARVRRHVGA